MIKHFDTRTEFLAAVAERGLVVRKDPPCHEGMHESDMFEPEVVVDANGEEVGVGQWERDGDVYEGNLADSSDEFFVWLNITEDARDVLSLDVEQVARVYSGKPGCGCGCRGSYWTDARNIKRVVAWMKREATESTTKRVGVTDGVAFVETETRYLWAYMKEDVPVLPMPINMIEDNAGVRGLLGPLTERPSKEVN